MSFLSNFASLIGGGSAASSATTAVSSLYTPILERGRFFYPAGLHYGNPAATVICDRCKRSGIKSCIGYESQDLCLPCVEQVVSSISVLPTASSRPLTNMEQDMMRTFMMQSDFSRPTVSDVGIRTRMEHSLYRINRN